MHKPIVVFIILTVLAGTFASQDNWNRYSWGTYDREGFTVLLPTVPEQIATENGEQGISALEGELFRDSKIMPLKDHLVFNVTFKDGVGEEEYGRQVEKWMNLVAAADAGGYGVGTGMGEREKAKREKEINLNRNTTEVSVCGYSGIEFGNSNSFQQFFLVDDRLYHAWVTGANKSSSNAAKFFNSFTLIKHWEGWKGIRTNVDFDDSEVPRFPLESSACKNIGNIKTKRPAKLPRNSALRLISKPPAKYPEEAKKKKIQGTVFLKVRFLKDGSIGEITVVKGIDKEIDESAIGAAKLIKFEPQRNGGKFITITKRIEYTFSIY
jgi:TonB family protein